MDFNETRRIPPTDPGQSGQTFLVCLAGIVWRVLVAMQGVVMLAAWVGSDGPAAAATRWAQASTVAVPATLLWLLLVCQGRRVMDRLGATAQAAIASGAAALCVALFWSLQRWVQQSWEERSAGLWALLPLMLTGAVMAWGVLWWLRVRARDGVPRDAQARLAELQARIRPHFLFNTLNTAIALVQTDPQRAEAVLEDLAELFRSALTAPQSPSRLDAEIELARRYLAIESLRFGERMRVSWEVDTALAGTELPALVLQPLIENAVRHGVEPDPLGGWIRIQVGRRGGQAVIEVTNSMPVVNRPAPASQPQGQGMALDNVRQRLWLMFDMEADFDAQARRDAASDAPVFAVRLAVPLGEVGES